MQIILMEKVANVGALGEVVIAAITLGLVLGASKIVKL